MPAPPPQIATGSEPLDISALRAAGFATVIHRDVVASTMDEARRLADGPTSALPALVVADRQTAGRGRRGAGWWQADGALAASIVIAGPDTGPPPIWALACGVALAEAIRTLAPEVPAVVRWPNDVEAGGRKIAGILVETATHGRTVVGIGVNTAGSAADAPHPLRRRVGTLPDMTGRTLSRGLVLAAFMTRFTPLIDELALDPEALPRRYRPLCCLDGTMVTIHVGAERHSGVCRGIAASGALMIDTAHGRRQFTSGSLSDPVEIWLGP